MHPKIFIFLFALMGMMAFLTVVQPFPTEEVNAIKGPPMAQDKVNDFSLFECTKPGEPDHPNTCIFYLECDSDGDATFHHSEDETALIDRHGTCDPDSYSLCYHPDIPIGGRKNFTQALEKKPFSHSGRDADPFCNRPTDSTTLDPHFAIIKHIYLYVHPLPSVAVPPSAVPSATVGPPIKTIREKYPCMFPGPVPTSAATPSVKQDLTKLTDKKQGNVNFAPKYYRPVTHLGASKSVEPKGEKHLYYFPRRVSTSAASPSAKQGDQKLDKEKQLDSGSKELRKRQVGPPVGTVNPNIGDTQPCSIGQVANVPNPKNCSKYTFCMNGYGQNFICPAGMKFDYVTAKCMEMSSGKVNCYRLPVPFKWWTHGPGPKPTST